MTSPVLLFGKNGQVGSALQNYLSAKGNIVALDRKLCDLANLSQLRRVIREVKPGIIVNAAAYTSVDKAEDDVAVCLRVNADAPAVIAEEARKLDAHVIHYSTDYVFDGKKNAPYREDDAPNPVNSYGRSKLAGDQAIEALGASSTILRVSWIYGPIGSNFAKTILKLAVQRQQLKIVADQFGAPTSSDLVARVTTEILDKIRQNGRGDFLGVFNLAPRGRVSWYGYAKELLEAASGRDPKLESLSEKLVPVPASEYPTRATRPSNSVLDTTKICKTFSISLPEWQPDVRRFAREWRGI